MVQDTGNVSLRKFSYVRDIHDGRIVSGLGFVPHSKNENTLSGRRTSVNTHETISPRYHYRWISFWFWLGPYRSLPGSAIRPDWGRLSCYDCHFFVSLIWHMGIRKISAQLSRLNLLQSICNRLNYYKLRQFTLCAQKKF